ncbi:MAG TPA: hypothetical protein VEZ16_11440, partial [Microvirga sp.]|nr:hypothetical protein [Microvirga sp.]
PVHRGARSRGVVTVEPGTVLPMRSRSRMGGRPRHPPRDRSRRRPVRPGGGVRLWRLTDHGRLSA